MWSKQYNRLRNWINYNSRNDDMISTTKDKKNYTRKDALDDLYALENLAHPKDEPSSPEKSSPELESGTIDTTGLHTPIRSSMPEENTSMPVMQLDEPFRISRPEAIKALMEILDVTVGDKVRILESLVLMYTKDEE